MCELFGMSSLVPTGVTLSLARLARHGNSAARLGDGWGVAYHDGRAVRLIKEPEPAEASPWVDFLERQQVRGAVVLAHIRHATQGATGLANTQPFVRALGGRMHAFAHNGNLAGLPEPPGGARFRPVGETDSEAAFALLLARLAPLWEDGVPRVAQRQAAVAAVAAELRRHGPANFLYTDGECLFAHADRRTQADGRIASPGLHMLHRSCATDAEALAAAGIGLGAAQTVTLFASVPLSDEDWRPLPAGTLCLARAGVPG